MSKYFFYNQDKLNRAKVAVKANGGDPSDEELVLKEYKALGGKWEDDKGRSDEAEEAPRKPRKTDDDNDTGNGEVIEVGDDGKVTSNRKKKK